RSIPNRNEKRAVIDRAHSRSGCASSPWLAKYVITLGKGGEFGRRSIPSDRPFIEVDVNLFSFKEFFDAVQAQFPAMAALFIAAPRRFHIARLHRVHPHDACAQAL